MSFNLGCIARFTQGPSSRCKVPKLATGPSCSSSPAGEARGSWLVAAAQRPRQRGCFRPKPVRGALATAQLRVFEPSDLSAPCPFCKLRHSLWRRCDPPAFRVFTLRAQPLEPREYAGMSAAGLHQEHARGGLWPLPEPLDDSGVCGEPPGDTEADLEKAIVADEAAAAGTLAALEQGKLLLSGGMAGAFSKSCTAPLARLTILYQVCRRCRRRRCCLPPAPSQSAAAFPPRCPLIHPHRPPPCALPQVQGMQPAAASAALPSQRAGVAAALRHVVQREGVRALWKGNGVTIIHRLPYSSANFWVYEQVRLLRCCCRRRWCAPRHLPAAWQQRQDCRAGLFSWLISCMLNPAA